MCRSNCSNKVAACLVPGLTGNPGFRGPHGDLDAAFPVLRSVWRNVVLFVAHGQALQLRVSLIRTFRCLSMQRLFTTSKHTTSTSIHNMFGAFRPSPISLGGLLQYVYASRRLIAPR